MSDCEHKWIDEDKKEIWRPTFSHGKVQIGIIYIQRCSKCQKISHEKIILDRSKPE